uniref:C2H2-type domain-containing protein n=1 Tax=Podarcis muralis TaxID=64176 RepID=A0A670ICP0_PODMU
AAPHSLPPPFPIPPLADKGPYICSLCAKEFKNGYNLRRHEAIHTGAKASRLVPSTIPLCPASL